MSLGKGVIGQSRLRPGYSQLGAAPTPQGMGQGIAFGMGTGSVRLQGITLCFFDQTGTTSLQNTPALVRVAVINGDYPLDATAFAWNSDLSNFDVLYDILKQTADVAHIASWAAPIVTDKGATLTVLVSQIYYPANIPAGVAGQTLLNVSADYNDNILNGGPPQ